MTDPIKYTNIGWGLSVAFFQPQYPETVCLALVNNDGHICRPMDMEAYGKHVLLSKLEDGSDCVVVKANRDTSFHMGVTALESYIHVLQSTLDDIKKAESLGKEEGK